MEILKYILFSSLISIPFVFIGLRIDTFLAEQGLIRSSKGAVIFGAIFSVFVKPFLFKSISWWIYSIMVLISLWLVVHQFELRESSKRGAFWWKREGKKNKKINHRTSW
jgi:hypothetical protein